MPSVIRKRGMNRGRPRIWLEGKILREAGFFRGAKFKICTHDASLELVFDPEGKRKVSGKADKPIIDIMGATLGPLQEVEQVRVTYTEGGGLLLIEDNANADTDH